MPKPREINPEHYALLHAYGVAATSNPDTLREGAAILQVLSLLTTDFEGDALSQDALTEARKAIEGMDFPTARSSPDRCAGDYARCLLQAIIDERNETIVTGWAVQFAQWRPFATQTVMASTTIDGFTIYRECRSTSFAWSYAHTPLPRENILMEAWGFDGYRWHRTIYHAYGEVPVRLDREKGRWEASAPEGLPPGDSGREIAEVAARFLNHHLTIGAPG